MQHSARVQANHDTVNFLVFVILTLCFRSRMSRLAQCCDVYICVLC